MTTEELNTTLADIMKSEDINTIKTNIETLRGDIVKDYTDIESVREENKALKSSNESLTTTNNSLWLKHGESLETKKKVTVPTSENEEEKNTTKVDYKTLYNEKGRIR